MSEVIWIDKSIYNEENMDYSNQLKDEIKYLKINLYDNTDRAINYLKSIKYEKVIIIVSGRLYSEFVKAFKENINDMFLVPKIIVFTSNKKKFIEKNEEYLNNDNKFYTLGGIFTLFLDVKEFLYLEDINCGKNYISNDKIYKPDNLNSSNETILTFEYIDCKEKLMLPMFFKSLIDYLSDKDIEEYTDTLYNIYSKEKEEVENCLGIIKSIPNIPIEILAKYYARFYTASSSFYKEMNKDLGMNKIDKYLLYIKILYEGVKLKSLPLASNNLLYRGSKISDDEIKIIISNMNKKIKDLPGVIVFSKTFLSFSKEKEIAEKFLKQNNLNPNLSKVLFILEKDDTLGYNLSTHGDIEEISYYPKEREVLFFPFSAFEIKNINKINIENENIYEIKLLYLGKYLKEIENDKNITKNENKIPESEFKNQLSESGLVKKEIIQNINTKKLFITYKEYERSIEGNDSISEKESIDREDKTITDNTDEEEKLSYNISRDNEVKIRLSSIKLTENKIIGEINIGPNDINKDIQIINSFENFKRIKQMEDKEDDLKYENEKEIKKNIIIKINKEKIDFSYTHNFEREGNYEIKYLFKNNLIKANHMFSYCKSFKSVDLSKFITKNVIDMSYMFFNSNSLEKLDISNFHTENVRNMSYMFYECNSLKELNIFNFKNFNTKNVENMSYMFYECYSLKELSLLNFKNFNTKNVVDMSYMFFNCNYLKYINLSNFNTKNVTNMSNMFCRCKSLKIIDLTNFETLKVTNMSYMFSECKSLKILDMSKFNTKIVNNMRHMFSECKLLKKLDLSNFNTENVNNMSYIFSECKSITELNISNFDTKNVTQMNNMFSNCDSITNLEISNFNTENVINMSEMFNHCISLSNLNLANFKTRNTKDMHNMFSECKKLEKLDILNFNTENVKNMSYMFYNCKSLKELNLSNFKTVNVINMESMFNNCESLTNLNVSKFNTINVTNMSYMFYNCSLLLNLNLSSFNASKVNNFFGMFSGCSSLMKKNIITKDSKILKILR